MKVEQYIQMQNILDQSEHNHANEMIMKSGLRFYTSQCFSIPAPIVDRYFHYYKLLYWSGHHILESIEAGYIVRDNIAFRVMYYRNLTRGNILNAKDEQYILSFRMPNPDWNIDPVVIISSITKGN